MIYVFVTADTKGDWSGWRTCGGHDRAGEVSWALSAWDIGGHVKSCCSNCGVLSRSKTGILEESPATVGLGHGGWGVPCVESSEERHLTAFDKTPGKGKPPS